MPSAHLQRYLVSVRRVALPLTFAFVLSGAQSSGKGAFGDLWRTAQSRSLASKRAALVVKAAELDATLHDKSDDPALTATAGVAKRYREAPPTGVTEKYSEDQTYGLQLTWPVYDFGRTSAARERYAQERRIAELSATAVNEELYWQLARAYQMAAHTDRLAAATLEQVGIAERKFGEQKRNYQQGLRSESDLVSAEVDLGRARIAHADAVSEARKAAIRLAQVVDGDASRARRAQTVALHPATTIAALVAKWTPPASRTNDAIRAAERAALDADADRVTSGLLPTLAVTGQVTGTGSFQPLTRTGSAALELAWTLPWNGQNRVESEQIAVRRSQLEIDEQSDREARRELELIGTDQLAAASSNWEAYERQLTLAEKQRQLTENRYRTGKASALELSTSEAAVISAKLDRVRLSHAAVLAAIDVAEARGIGPESNLLQQLFD